MARGVVNRAFKFEVVRPGPLVPDLQLSVLVSSETGPRPVVVNLAASGAVTGKDSTQEQGLVFQDDPNRSYHAMVKELYDRAGTDFLRKDYSGARGRLERALELDPDNFQVKKLLGRVSVAEAGGRNAAGVEKARRQWDAGEPDIALENLKSVLASDPGFKPALDLKKRIEGSESGKKSLERKRILRAARVAEKSGDFVEAERRYREASECDPTDEEVRVGLRRVTGGETRREARLPEKKEEGADRVQKADRAYNLGLDCYRKGDLEGARKFWEETLEYQPGHFQAKRNLDRLARSAGGTP